MPQLVTLLPTHQQPRALLLRAKAERARYPGVPLVHLPP